MCIRDRLEIMDEYLAEIYKNKFWGYSLPLYLSAVDGCHPNYAIYLAEKDTLTVKSFNELLRSIPKDDKAKFSKENAEKYYKKYQENFYDDKGTVSQLSETFKAVSYTHLDVYKRQVLCESGKEKNPVCS